MAVYNITATAYVNQPPNRLGNITITKANRTNHIFTQANFTTETTPTYRDPENDDPANIQIKSLPSTGSLELNSVTVIVDQVINWADINSGLLVYIANSQDSLYTDNFTFDIADVGSNTFSGTPGTVTMSISEYQNQPPSSVGNNTLSTSYGTTTVFTTADFTTGTTPVYTDPEGDPASRLKITALPGINGGTLLYNGVQVVLNQVITFADIASGLLTYYADGTVAGYSSSFEYEISDTGSEQFTG